MAPPCPVSSSYRASTALRKKRYKPSISFCLALHADVPNKPTREAGHRPLRRRTSRQPRGHPRFTHFGEFQMQETCNVQYDPDPVCRHTHKCSSEAVGFSGRRIGWTRGLGSAVSAGTQIVSLHYDFMRRA